MRRVEIMKKLSMPREEITAYLMERFQMRAVRQYLTDEAIHEARYDDAIKLLQESKKMDAQYPKLVSEHSGKLSGTRPHGVFSFKSWDAFPRFDFIINQIIAIYNKILSQNDTITYIFTRVSK